MDHPRTNLTVSRRVLTPNFSTNSGYSREFIIHELGELYSHSGGWGGVPYPVLSALYFAGVNCARISEMLNLRYSDHIGNARYVVRGLKRSRSYSVHLQGYYPPAGYCDADLARIPVFSTNYDTVYRWCRRIGLGSLQGRRKYFIRTHLHRYITAKRVRKAHGVKFTSAVLHHKSIDSQEYYINKGECTDGKN
jgi:hypothetical protein